MHGSVRVVIATSSLGMGANIPIVKRVIIFQVPENVEAHLPAIGRGGRMALMYFPSCITMDITCVDVVPQ